MVPLKKGFVPSWTVLRRVFSRTQLPGHMVHQLLDKGHLGNQKEEFQQSWFWGVKNWWEKKKLRCWKKNPWKIDDCFHHFERIWEKNSWGIVFFRDGPHGGVWRWKAGKHQHEVFKDLWWLPPRSWDYLLMMPKKSGKSNDRNLGTWETKWFWSLKTILLENFSHRVIPNYANKHGEKKNKKKHSPPKFPES